MPITPLHAFSTATEMLSALRDRTVSATELLDQHLRRIERLNGPFNAFIPLPIEQARADATQADAARARGDDRPLLGLPVTVKESIDVAGSASTAGLPGRMSHRAAHDARSVAALRAAGAVVFGKTNVCPYLADYIADNRVFGRTSSPWNPNRTPGGSSGGSATLAAGFTPLDLGSDLGGSIRIPAAFCGLWGHKPSEGAVPNSGHFPGSDLPNAATVMAAQGPLARSASDLELMLDTIAGPDVGADAAWRLRIPASRHKQINEFRVAVLPWQDWLPVDPEIMSAMEGLAANLRTLGTTVEVRSPLGKTDLREFYQLARCIMSVIVSSRMSPEQRRQMIDDRKLRGEFSHLADARGFSASASDYLAWHGQRELYRQAYRDFFRDWDILLTPMSLVPPFPHPTQPVADRKLSIDGREIGFDYLSFYPAVASLVGHGATAFPIGFNTQGLPLGAQAIAPFLEDRTAIRFAQLVEQARGGFIPPPGLDQALS